MSLSRGSKRLAALAAALAAGCCGGLADEPAAAEQTEALTGITGGDQVIYVDHDGQTVEIPYILTEEGFAIYGGDIVLGEAAAIHALSQQQNELQSLSNIDLFGLFQLSRRIWPKGIVKYRIAAALKNAERVEDAIASWEKATDIRFVEAPSGTRDYVEFVPVQRSDNCSSRVGYAGSRQYVHVGDGCSTGNLMHEIGHVLGIAHENMRSDQREFITIHTQNIRDGYQNQFEPMPWAYGETGEYCYGSLMHYGPKQWSWNGRPTIVKKKSGPEVGQRSHIADCDAATIQTKYRGEFAKR